MPGAVRKLTQPFSVPPHHPVWSARHQGWHAVLSPVPTKQQEPTVLPVVWGAAQSEAAAVLWHSYPQQPSRCCGPASSGTVLALQKRCHHFSVYMGFTGVPGTVNAVQDSS